MERDEETPDDHANYYGSIKMNTVDRYESDESFNEAIKTVRNSSDIKKRFMDYPKLERSQNFKGRRTVILWICKEKS